MSKSNRMYKIFMTSMIVIIAGLLLATGIIAVQKSMKLSVGVSITPSMLCKITDSSNNVLFCNTTKNSQSLYVTEGASISGNMLTLNKSFSNLGGEFALKIYNYTTVATSGNVIKVTASGTGVETTSMWLPSYSSGTPTAGEINVTAVAGQVTLQFEEVAKPSFTVTYNLTNCTSNKTSGASVTYGTSYSATITPTTGYLLPSTITVANIGAGGYSWDYSTGVFTITDWTKVNGNITVTVIAREPFTFYQYSDYTAEKSWLGDQKLTAPAARDTNTYYKYFCTFGTYPQSYVGADASVVSGLTPTPDPVTYAYNNKVTFYADSNGVNKYASVEVDGATYYYEFEPIRWIVLGVDTSGSIAFNGDGGATTTVDTENTSSILFTDALANAGKLKIENNRIYYDENGNSTFEDSEKQTNLLLLSELALDNEYFGYNHYDSTTTSYCNEWKNTNCDVRRFLNDTAGATGTTTHQATFATISGLGQYYATEQNTNLIQRTNIKTTTYVNNSTPGNDNDGYYNMFLLGSNRNYNSGYKNNYTDSYNIASYFPIYTGTGTGASGYIDAIKAKVTPFAVANGAYTNGGSATSNTLGASYWWLRSGRYDDDTLAYYVYNLGSVVYNLVYSSDRAVRPSFILNLA